jgi:hypothetical protein
MHESKTINQKKKMIGPSLGWRDQSLCLQRRDSRRCGQFGQVYASFYGKEQGLKFSLDKINEVFLKFGKISKISVAHKICDVTQCALFFPSFLLSFFPSFLFFSFSVAGVPEGRKEKIEPKAKKRKVQVEEGEEKKMIRAASHAGSWYVSSGQFPFPCRFFFPFFP